jgi:hypothetical protein
MNIQGIRDSSDIITLLLSVDGIEEMSNELWCRRATDDEVESFREEVYAVYGMSIDRMVCGPMGQRYDYVTITKEAPEEIWSLVKDKIRLVSLDSP